MSGGGDGDGDGVWILVRDAREWALQVRESLAQIKAANGGEDPATLRDSYDVDPVAFSAMIEGLVALNVSVSDELIRLAGLRDIGEVLS